MSSKLANLILEGKITPKSFAEGRRIVSQVESFLKVARDSEDLEMVEVLEKALEIAKNLNGGIRNGSDEENV